MMLEMFSIIINLLKNQGISELKIDWMLNCYQLMHARETTHFKMNYLEGKRSSLSV